MWLKTAKALLVVITLAASAAAQPPAGESVAGLKEQIGKLEAIDRDPSTDAEVKALNRQFLDARRAQLRALVRKSVDALRAYKAAVGSTLSAEENARIDQSLQALAGELSGPASAPAGPAAPAEDEALAAPPPTSSSGPGAAGPASPPDSATPPAEAPARPSAPAAAAQPAGAAAPIPAPGCNLYEKDPKAFSLVDQYVCNLARDVEGRKSRNPTAGLNLIQDFGRLVIVLEAKKGRVEEFLRAEHARVDKQIGAESSNAGTTTLVSKGNIPAVLGFAVENGALEREADGTSVTFRANPVGLFKAMDGQGVIGGYDADDDFTRFLRRFALGVTFDTGRGDSPGTFTGRRQQLSSVSARAVLYDKRDPRRAEFKKDWEDFLGASGQNFLRQNVRARAALTETDLTSGVTTWKDPALARWYDETQRALAAAAPSDIEKVLVGRLNELPLDDLTPETTNVLADFEREFGIYLRDRNAVLKKAGRAGVLTLDYVNERNVDAPNLSRFKLIGEKGFRNGRLDLTGDAAFTLFDAKPAAPDTGRLRDAQAALQLDGTFGRPEAFGVFVLSFAYKYQRMVEDAVAGAGLVAPGTRGDINVGQLKLTVPFKPLGLRIPLSVTFANRTELIKEREVRGNFGFTFDLDQILAKLKPF